MKVYVLILGLFAICINGCNTNNRNEKPEKDVVVKESTHPVAEVVPPKIAARPLLPGKRTGKLDDIPAFDASPQLKKKIRFDGMDEVYPL